MKMVQHPSGRPLRHNHRVGKRHWNIPDKGSVIPRLQPGDKKTEAIGFTVQSLDADDYGNSDE